MKADDAIKLMYEDEAADINLSMEKAEDILDFIELQAEEKAVARSSGVRYRARSLLKKLRIKDFIEVACVIMVLVMIPAIINHQKNKSNDNATIEIENTNNNTEVEVKKNSFMDKLEQHIEKTKLLGISIKEKFEDVKDMDTIKKKSIVRNSLS